MGREISEGHVHELETQLTVAKDYAEELKRKFKELETHCSALDEEAEDIQQQVFVLKAQQEERSISRSFAFPVLFQKARQVSRTKRQSAENVSRLQRPFGNGGSKTDFGIDRAQTTALRRKTCSDARGSNSGTQSCRVGSRRRARRVLHETSIQIIKITVV